MINLKTLLISFAIFIAACNSNEIGNSKDVNPESIYFDYRIWAEEGKEDVTCLLQYRFGGKNGTTLVIEGPGKVELDGEAITVDSAKLTGAFYEIIKPINSFTGKHTITFTNPEKKQYKEEFTFQPFSLKTEIPEVLNRGELVFELEGLEPEDYVHIVATDTAFYSEDINQVDTVRNGRIVITREQLKNLTNGPITLQLYKEEEKPVKKSTKEGGRLFISYGLKREFELNDTSNPAPSL